MNGRMFLVCHVPPDPHTWRVVPISEDQGRGILERDDKAPVFTQSRRAYRVARDRNKKEVTNAA